MFKLILARKAFVPQNVHTHKQKSSEKYTSKNWQVFEGGRASLIAQLVKNPPAMQETPVQFLGREDPTEKGQATYSSILGLPV